MADPRVSLLIVDNDRDLLARLCEQATSRGYVAVGAPSTGDALAAIRGGNVHAALVSLELGAESGLDLIEELKSHDADTEIIALSHATSVDSAIRSYDRAAFAFVQKPADANHLFATVERALERRRMNLHNRRLVWELHTINGIAEVISRSLELDDVLTGALQELTHAMDAISGSIRLRNEVTGTYDLKAFIGPPHLPQVWNIPGVRRPSTQVIATRAACVLEDLADLVGPEHRETLPIRSGISVPMLGNDELIGTISLGSVTPHRFDVADERLLSIIAGQIAVAVENARLHDFVRRGKREWERTFDAISDPIAVFDGYGRLLRGNRALAAQLRKPVTALRQTSCHDIGFCGGGCPACAVGTALSGGGDRRGEITFPDGQIFSVTTFPIAGGPDGASVVQVAKNVTEEIRSARRLRQMSEELGLANARLMAAVDRLKSTQAQLLQAEKLSAIGQLVAGVAHELNNPLTSVIGYAQLLEEEFRDAHRQREPLRDPEELAQDLRRIAEESERAARIVRNLLAFARRQSAARAPQDVAELISRVLSLRTYEFRLNGIELVTDFERDLPPLVADGSQLQQALLNLILNAEQAMRGRTTRRLTVGARYDDSAAAIELFVADTGHGIDDANLTRIFDPFFTTRDVGEGTGLGLSICYGIVRDHGGQIGVESKVQAGTRFSLLLPARVEGASVEGEQILVAHTDQGDRDFICAALSAWGLSAVPAGRCDEALARYTTSRLQAVIVDHAILGADLAAWTAARANGPRPVPLVLMSMTTEDGDVERFGREQASAILAPPIQLRALRAAVRAVAKECV